MDRSGHALLAVAWLVCFRRAILAGVVLGLALSLVPSVLSASPSIVTTRTATPDGPVVVSRGVPVRTDLDGLAVRAAGNAAGAGDEAEPRESAGAVPSPGSATSLKIQTDVTAARTTPRALAVPRGQPLTVETSRDPATLVTLAAYEFGVDPTRMLALMACESSGDGEQIGDSGLAVGIFQWHSQTWRQYEARLGYTMADYGSTEAQARLTAWMFANGHAGLWSCAR